MNKDRLNYRKADHFDLEELVSLRKKQLIDERIEPSIAIDDELHQFFQTHLKDHTLVEWVLEDEGKIIATSAILFMDFPPTYTNKSGKKGYITNMYTAPEWRH